MAERGRILNFTDLAKIVSKISLILQINQGKTIFLDELADNLFHAFLHPDSYATFIQHLIWEELNSSWQNPELFLTQGALLKALLELQFSAAHKKIKQIVIYLQS